MTDRSVAVVVGIVVGITCFLATGCAKTPRTPRDGGPKPATRATTSGVASEHAVTSRDFERLWNAAADVARDRQFVIDRRDYRGGLLTTEPLVSAQFFEPWRRDTVTAEAAAESSLATIRRTIRFTFTRLGDGRYSVVPVVIVERYSSPERRLTSAMHYRSAFRRTTATGTRESDRGVRLPGRYWYRLPNDDVLAGELAEDLRRRL